MSITRLGQIGVGVREYPGFLPKGLGHNPGIITRLGQCGFGSASYPGFLPKAPADGGVSPIVITRLGQIGITARRYPGFLPKAPAIVDQPGNAYYGGGSVSRFFDAKTNRYEIPIASDIDIEDEEILMTILCEIAIHELT